MSNPQIALVTRDLRVSRLAALLAFVFTAGINVFLLGYFARFGGLELVGRWALLNAVVMGVSILDLGLTNALTFRIGRDGVAAVLPVMRRLMWLVVLAALGLGMAVGLALAFGLPMWAAGAVASGAALVQLMSHWLITLRMGQHQQHWFNIKTILRVVVQAAAALVLLALFPDATLMVLALALLFGGIAELGATVFLIRADMAWTGVLARHAEVREMAAGFGRDSFAQRALQPLSQFLVGHMLGAGAVGVFTVALRIPVSVNQALTEALRALLPGLAHVLSKSDRESAVRLIRDAVVIQAALILPVGTLLFFHAEALIEVWIGAADPTLVSALRALLMAMAIMSLCTPFYWAAQAVGEARAIGTGGLVKLVLVLAGGAVTIWATESVVAFSGIYAVGLAGFALFSGVIAQVRAGLVLDVVRGIRVSRVAAFAGVIVAWNLVVLSVAHGWAAPAHLGAAVFANAAVIGPMTWFILTGALFLRAAAPDAWPDPALAGEVER